MTRHMPGPPECECATSKTGLTVYTLRCQRHSPFSAAHLALHPPKRLTDAECAAEYWREQAEWWVGMHQKGPTAEGVDIRRAVIWERFATRPHALEES